MSFSEYFNAQAYHVAQIARLPVFTDLIVPLDDLYQLSVDLVPSASRPYYERLLLLCHKAFMSAASSIARGQPDDSHGVSRRACEAARIARAIKYKADNLKAWQAYDERLARWEARGRNERPKTLRRPDIQDPPGNEFVQQLLARISRNFGTRSPPKQRLSSRLPIWQRPTSSFCGPLTSAMSARS